MGNEWVYVQNGPVLNGSTHKGLSFLDVRNHHYSHSGPNHQAIFSEITP
jgi:hypothetical protein